MAITPLMPVYPRSPVRPVRGEGVYLYGEQGEKYLDFASGIAVNLLGHGHPHLTRAIQDQAATLIHVSNLYGSPMPYMMRMTNDGISIHGSDSVAPGYATHGCVAVPTAFAKKLFEAAKLGDIVIVTSGKRLGMGEAIIRT